ncbi:polyketide synthase dehydratase domain-containing protein, partial [Mycobacterium simiae]|uniref:polyketide synthase dehydratase domain-containing protein n=1 Tax=Mycobacterium simiae TaxID=1784 RepID=UPI00165EF21D
LISGRLSTTTHPWLAGHKVGDTVIFPATGFLDLLLYAGGQTGCPTVEELILHTPLPLADHHSADLQITIHPRNDAGRQAVTVHSRTSGDHHDHTWVLHASATLSAEQTSTPAHTPVPVLQAIDSDGFYEPLAAQGLGYQSPFQGVLAIGRDPADPDTVEAEIALPPD